MSKIPVTVIIVTKNEAHNLPRCLGALQEFDEIIVVDSQSADGSESIAAEYGVLYVPFVWNGAYPKKRQWCLDTLNIKHDFVFWVDADEVVPPVMVEEIRTIFLPSPQPSPCGGEGEKRMPAGYFVKGANVVDGHVCRFGLRNNKLALFNRHIMRFPVVDDLDIPGMGEIEGHYQPVLKPEFTGEEIGRVKTPLHHYAYEDKSRWEERHHGYARWEAAMIARKAYPQDPSPFREGLKRVFRAMPFRSQIVFLYSFIVRGGFLDGKAGCISALCKAQYYSKTHK